MPRISSVSRRHCAPAVSFTSVRRTPAITDFQFPCLPSTMPLRLSTPCSRSSGLVVQGADKDRCDPHPGPPAPIPSFHCCPSRTQHPPSCLLLLTLSLPGFTLIISAGGRISWRTIRQRSPGEARSSRLGLAFVLALITRPFGPGFPPVRAEEEREGRSYRRGLRTR